VTKPVAEGDQVGDKEEKNIKQERDTRSERKRVSSRVGLEGGGKRNGGDMLGQFYVLDVRTM